MGKNLFDEEIVKDPLLRDKFLEPPFSVIDTKGGDWRRRKAIWKKIGIKSEVGRDSALWKGTNSSFANAEFGKKEMATESIFDPVLCEILYHWYLDNFKEENEVAIIDRVNVGAEILDPFAGGSVRGIVANYLGYKYTGIDIRQEQIDSNYEQAKIIIPDRIPLWLVGDSNKVLDSLILNEYDLLFSCPPYADLEVYSDLQGDISNMKYPEFLKMYRSIIKKSCILVKQGGYAIFVVGEVRDKKSGKLHGFVQDTVDAFRECGMTYYNHAILLNAIGTAMLRVGTIFVKGDRKLVNLHQTVLIFKKP